MSSTFVIRQNKKGELSFFEMPRDAQERLMNFVELSLKNSQLLPLIDLFNGFETGNPFSLDALIKATEIMVKTIDDYGADWEALPEFKSVGYSVDELHAIYTRLQINCKKLIGQNGLEFHSQII